MVVEVPEGKYSLNGGQIIHVIKVCGKMHLSNDGQRPYTTIDQAEKCNNVWTIGYKFGQRNYTGELAPLGAA